MKKLLLGIALTLAAGNSFAGDELTMTPSTVSLKPGETAEVTVVLNAAEVDTYSALQVVIAMPEGVEPVCINPEEVEEGEDPIYLSLELPSTTSRTQRNAWEGGTNAIFYPKGTEFFDDKTKELERISEKNELHVVFMTTKAYTFPKSVEEPEPLFTFEVKATDRTYTEASTIDLTRTRFFVVATQQSAPIADKEAIDFTYTIPYTIGASGYGTLCWPVALDFTSNAFTAGIGKVSGVNMKQDPKTQVPANTPVIIVGEPGDYTLSTTRDEVAEITDNDLEGTVDEPLKVTTSNIFVLATKNEGTGFYRCDASAGVVIPQYKAYYTGNPGTAADSFLFEETTGISQVEAAESVADTYTLTGVKVNKANKKGVYIVNGKKVVVK